MFKRGIGIRDFEANRGDSFKQSITEFLFLRKKGCDEIAENGIFLIFLFSFFPFAVTMDW